MAPWKTRMTIIGTRAAPQFLTLIQAPRTDRTGETCPRWSTGWVDPYRLWSMTKKRTRKSTEIYGNLWKSMDEDESNIRAFEYAPQRQMTNFRYLGQWWIKKNSSETKMRKTPEIFRGLKKPLVSLVGGNKWFQPLWKILVRWDDDIPNSWKVIKFMFQSPPTRYYEPSLTIINHH